MRGILYPDSTAHARQEAYAKLLGALDIIAFSLESDAAGPTEAAALSITPTRSASKLRWGWDALAIGKTRPRPDVVSVQDPFETGLVGYFLARHFKVPLHVQVHTDFLAPEYAKLSPINRIRVLIAGFVLKQAARVRVVSPRIERSIRTMYHLAVPVTVLPIFTDLSRANAVAEPSLATPFSQFASRLLVVSRLEPEKNVELAIRAFAAGAPLSACLIVIGDGSERARLEQSARSQGLVDRIFFEGERDAPRYYALADLVLVPSKYEGYGLVIVEALAAGRPVLSTDVGVAREAGAIVASERDFTVALSEWFKNGPKKGELRTRPYESLDTYVRAYCDDIAACISAPKT